MGAELFSCGRTNVTKLTVALGTVAKAPRADSVVVFTMTRLSKLDIPSSYSQGFG